jgi:hypothetical protein
VFFRVCVRVSGGRSAQHIQKKKVREKKTQEAIPASLLLFMLALTANVYGAIARDMT